VSHMTQPMMRMGFLFVSALGLLLPGCRRDDTLVAEKLDKVIKQNDQIIDLLQKGGAGARGAAGAQRPQRPRPSPEEVYAVPLEGAPWVGNKDAKVTIVEAFEFA
jgi:protein-disulfide isomerase